MKPVKNIFVVALAIALFSCGKYEEGPAFSLRTKEARLTGKWNTLKADGTSIGSTAKLIIEFDKVGDNRTYTQHYFEGDSLVGYRFGLWELADKKEYLVMKTSGADLKCEILRLTNKELWFKDPTGLRLECEKE